MLKKILKTIWREKAKMLKIGLMLTLLINLDAQNVFAASTDDYQIDVIRKANTVLSFLSALVWPMLIMVGALMDNNLIFGSGFEERLLTLWAQFRDLANIGLVIILLIAALRNIVSFGDSGENQWALKTLLPKFVIALVLINFSFVGAKVILDVSNVVTTAVFALPDAIREQKFELSHKLDSEKICQEIQEAKDNPLRARSFDAYMEQRCNPETRGTALFMESVLGNFNTRNAALALAINMGKLHMKEIKKPTIAFIKDFLLNTLFSLFMFIIYFVSFAALFLVLLGRLIILWVAVTISPLLVAGLFFKDLIGGSAGGKIDELKTKVTSSITAPITLGLFMSTGYIMLDTFQSREDFYFDIPLANTDTQISGNEDLRQVMIAIITAAVVWKGTEWATEGTIFSGVISGFRGKLAEAGKWLGKAPFKYIPAIPIPTPEGEKKISLSGLLEVPGRIQSQLDAKYGNQMDKIFGNANTENILRDLNQTATSDVPTRARKVFEMLQNPEYWRKKEIRDTVVRIVENTPQLKNLEGGQFMTNLKEAASKEILTQEVRQKLTDALSQFTAGTNSGGAARQGSIADTKTQAAEIKNTFNEITGTLKTYLTSRNITAQIYDAFITNAQKKNALLAAATANKTYKEIADLILHP